MAFWVWLDHVGKKASARTKPPLKDHGLRIPAVLKHAQSRTRLQDYPQGTLVPWTCFLYELSWAEYHVSFTLEALGQLSTRLRLAAATYTRRSANQTQQLPLFNILMFESAVMYCENQRGCMLSWLKPVEPHVMR
eukprot:5474869-Amphidinium_carterae.1